MESSLRVSETLLDKLERVPLLIEYVLTCGIRQHKLLSYISKLQKANQPLIPNLQPEALKLAGLHIEVTSTYPPTSKTSYPVPADIQHVMHTATK